MTALEQLTVRHSFRWFLAKSKKLFHESIRANDPLLICQFYGNASPVDPALQRFVEVLVLHRPASELDCDAFDSIEIS